MADDLWPSVRYRYETQYRHTDILNMPVQLSLTDLPWLMREVERLRAENAAYRAIVERVAHMPTDGIDPTAPYHETVTQARALLGNE
jgi:hypothetical protein